MGHEPFHFARPSSGSVAAPRAPPASRRHRARPPHRRGTPARPCRRRHHRTVAAQHVHRSLGRRPRSLAPVRGARRAPLPAPRRRHDRAHRRRRRRHQHRRPARGRARGADRAVRSGARQDHRRRHDGAVPAAASAAAAAARAAAAVGPPARDGRDRSLVRRRARIHGAAARRVRRLSAPGRLAAAPVAGRDPGSVHSPDRPRGTTDATARGADRRRRAHARDGPASARPGAGRAAAPASAGKARQSHRGSDPEHRPHPPAHGAWTGRIVGDHGRAVVGRHRPVAG